FVQDVNTQGGVIAWICRGSMLAARSKIVMGRRMTGFNDGVSFPDLVVKPDAEAAGATWVQDAPVIVDRNLITSPHPRHSTVFSAAINSADNLLGDGACKARDRPRLEGVQWIGGPIPGR